MHSEKKVSRARAVMCALLCATFAALTTYQLCFYTLFTQYQKDLSDIKTELSATIDAQSAENEALRTTVAALEIEVAALTENLTELAGKTDATAEECLRHLLRRGLSEFGKTASVTASDKVDALVDSYMTAYADDALAVATRLLFVDFLYRENYYGPAPTYEEAEKVMIEGYIHAAHDLYAQHYTADEYQRFLDKMNASVSGIGAATAYDENGQFLLVLHTHTDSPAKAAGLLPYDRITKVDNKSFSSAEEAAALIGGTAGSTVYLTVERDGAETCVYPITRAKVVSDSVLHRTYTVGEETVGYLRIVSFNNATLSQFETAYADLLAKGASSLVLDLRDNTGGILQVAIDLLDRILPAELPLVSYNYQNKNNEPAPILSRDDGRALDLPITLLINRETASAAEIFAAALRGNDRVLLIGEETKDKGVIQTGYPLGDGSYVYLTVAAYHSPTFGEYDGEGAIPPDIPVAVAAGYEERHIYILPEEADLPLQRALSEAAALSANH